MKALYTFFLGCFCVGVMLAQSDIASVEYYFDTDPGIGNGIILDIDPDVDILDQNFNISTTGLSQGTHRLFLRVVNVNGSSSMYTHKTFRIYDLTATNSADIVEAEYFFNQDPGAGLGTIIDLVDAESIDQALNVPTTGLPIGTHKLFVRVKNSNDEYSLYEHRAFRVAPAPDNNTGDIVEAEYFIDVDPGFGSATALSVSGDNLDENITIPTSVSLAQGDHYLHIRVLNADGTWSLYDRKLFEIDGTLGIDSDDLSEIRIFPIPTSDYVNIKTPNHIQIKSIGIIDLNGKVVMQLNDPMEKINLSNLQQGVYLLQIQTQNGNLSKRMIKN
ncbi:MAG: T9SS type A sorting domain-containing protein [Xanthomarina gelatinilytica]|uniref:T9SS type A sorting domain-containing protein n=1 Tax=Xanthomarina gelatinilytica TaxID=1137281 RepID=UPI003A8A19D8